MRILSFYFHDKYNKKNFLRIARRINDNLIRLRSLKNYKMIIFLKYVNLKHPKKKWIY